MIPDVEAVSIDLTVPLSAVRVLQAGWEAFRVWGTEVDTLSCCERSLEEVVSVLDTFTKDTADEEPPEGRTPPGE
jgi:hypothetical protein